MRLSIRLSALAATLALMGAGPAPLPLDHLLGDAVAARAFDYGALRESLGPDGLKALDQQVRGTLQARRAADPGQCEPLAEAFVRQGVASAAIADDAATWRADWRTALDMLDRLNAETAAKLASDGASAPPEDSVGAHLRAAKATTDPRLRELFTRAAADQASRKVWAPVRGLPDGPRKMVSAPLGGQGCRIDADNTAWLKAQVRQFGWFTVARDGEQASEAAWLLVQHADRDPTFQEEVLAILAKLQDSGANTRINYAYLADRVAVNAKRPQTYGTQGHCVGPGAWEPSEVRDPDGLDARLAEVGLPPEAEYKAHFKDVCANYKP